MKDKEFGKSLNDQTLLVALALFFYDGSIFRNDIIDSMISKLYDLREAVKRVHLLGGFDYRATGDSGRQAFYSHMKGMGRIKPMFI